MSRPSIVALQTAESRILEIELSVGQRLLQTVLYHDRATGTAKNTVVILGRLNKEIKTLNEEQDSFLRLLPSWDYAAQLQRQLKKLDEAAYSARSAWVVQYIKVAPFSIRTAQDLHTTMLFATEALEALKGLLPSITAVDSPGIKQSKYEERVRSMQSAVSQNVALLRTEATRLSQIRADLIWWSALQVQHEYECVQLRTRAHAFGQASTPANRVAALDNIVQAERLYTSASISKELTNLASRHLSDLQANGSLPTMQEQHDVPADAEDPMQIDLDLPKSPKSSYRAQVSTTISAPSTPRGGKRRASTAFEDENIHASPKRRRTGDAPSILGISNAG